MSLEKALERSRALTTTAHDQAVRLKDAGTLSGQVAADNMSMFGQSRDQVRSRQRYNMFRGWLYSAINALASEAAGQSVNAGREVGAPEEDERRTLPRRKTAIPQKVSSSLRQKAARQELEVLSFHPILDSLERPNPIQDRWQFVYTFVANLNLTGWAYVVFGENSETGQVEMYCLPTTWVTPIHKNGPFSQIKVRNPNKPGEEGETFERDQFGFAHLPNPSDPLGALSPAASQHLAIRIDDYIQASQETFFDNGIFPSVVVSIGRDPHPDVPGGIRPRLTQAQRRQVHAVIRKTMAGVANYGNPAIVDGLIEKIERLSATQNEMGWDKSEDKVRTRILSAFCVHPYILGEPVNVGGYAQAAKIEERFCKRVNTFLDMLGCLISTTGAPLVEENLLVWWTPCEPHDPALHWKNLNEARKRKDISQNELRAELGYPPDEDRNEQVLDVQMLGPLGNMLNQVRSGGMTPEQLQAVLEGLGIPTDLAVRIAGDETQMVAPALDIMEEAVRLLREPVRITTR